MTAQEQASTGVVTTALIAQTRAGYDAAAVAYAERLPDTSFEAPLDMAIVDHFPRALPAGASVLDAGCGSGRMLRHLHDSDPSYRLTGLDLSPGMLAQAAALHLPANLYEGELAALPFADATFDGVLAWYSIIHTRPEDVPRLLDEMRRVLRRTGLLLLGFQSGTGVRTIERPYGQGTELTAFLHQTSSIAQQLCSAGFAIDTILDRTRRASEKQDQGFILARAT